MVKKRPVRKVRKNTRRLRRPISAPNDKVEQTSNGSMVIKAVPENGNSIKWNSWPFDFES